jgi:hypothetical protein
MEYRPVERLAARGVLVVALLVFFALALDAAGRKAVTTDEPLHLLRGAALSQSGDFSLQYEHTPLSHRLIGALAPTEPTLPLVTELPARPSGDRSAIAHELLWESGLDVDRMVLLGRLPIVWTGVLLGAAVALWTAAATGRSIPALAVVMTLYATSSNLLASAALATTDLLAAATYFATMGAWWFYCRRPGRGRWLMTGTLLGLALGTKLTSVLLIPLLVVLAYVYPRRGDWRRPGLTALSLLPVAALVLWAVYAFQIGPWRGVTAPAPAYWESWATVLTHVSGGHLAFFLGRLSAEGWWLYFPVTFLIKTPAVFLGLLVAALLWLIRDRAARRIGAFTLLPAAVLFAVAAVSRLNIGYRHVLPALPFLLVTIGLVIPALWSPGPRLRPWSRLALGLAMLWTAVAGLRQQPDHLAYFSELVGGSAQGYRYLGDSNLDWGQDLKQLAVYARDYWAQTGRPLFFSYTGAADPAYYGLDGRSLIQQFQAGQADFAPANPAAGRYAINVSDLQGPGLTLGALSEIDLFDWFRRREPLMTLGDSIFIYDVTQQADGQWIAHCLTPGSLLPDNEAERLIGRAGLRHVRFDCRSNWVFPEGDTPGWYVLPPDAEWWIDAWLDEPRPEVVYRHRANDYGPDYAIAYWPGSSGGPALSDEAQPYPNATDGPASLRAFGARDNEWITVWRAAEPTAAPLSIQAHLFADGAVQVADGLGFSADQWRPGDWFIQRHVFDAPGETLETGLYNYVTVEPASERVRLEK